MKTFVTGSIKKTDEQSFEYDDQARIQSNKEEFQPSNWKNVKKRKIPLQLKLENLVAGSILTSDEPDTSIHKQGIQTNFRYRILHVWLSCLFIISDITGKSKSSCGKVRLLMMVVLLTGGSSFILITFGAGLFQQGNL